MKWKIIAIVALGLLVFGISLGNGFVWDDEELIVNNTLIQSISNWPKFFAGGAFNSGGAIGLAGPFYKPLMTLSFSFIYSIFGASPAPYHLFSLTLHIFNTVLVFLFFEKLFQKTKNNIPIILALIFLTHPLYSEVVFYTANFQDVLYFFFGMLALYISTGERLNIKKYLLIGVLLTASLLSKETGIIFVGAIGLYAILFNTKRTKAAIFVSISSFIFYAVLRFGVAKVFFQKMDISPLANQNLDIRLLNLPKIAFYYFQNLIYPVNIVPNQHWLITTPSLLGFWLPLVFLIIFLVIVSIPAFRKNKIYIYFLVIFLTSLFFHLQIIPLDATVSGRWFYLPMFGLLGMMGAAIPNSKFLVGGAIIITILSVRTFVRSLDWYSGLTLYSHDAAIVKNDFNLENNLGVELYRVGRIDEAGVHFQNSVNVAPNWWTNWNNLGAFREYKGDFKTAEVYYKKAIDNGNYYLAYENYVKILIKEKKIKEAKDFLEGTALKYFPGNQNLRYLYQYLLQN